MQGNEYADICKGMNALVQYREIEYVDTQQGRSMLMNMLVHCKGITRLVFCTGVSMLVHCKGMILLEHCIRNIIGALHGN